METVILASSSSGNCTLLSHGNTHVLIDAGLSMRRTAECVKGYGLEISELAGIFFTHAHSDHTCGIKMLAKHHKLPIFASYGTSAELIRQWPETEPLITRFFPGEEICIGDLAVKSCKTQHDSPESVCFSFCAGNTKMLYMTDLGCVTSDIEDLARGAQLAVIESNHDVSMLKRSTYPYRLKQRILSDSGHLSNDDCGKFAVTLAKNGADTIILAHLSRENNTPQLACSTVSSALETAGACAGTDISVYVAAPSGIPNRFCVSN